MQKLFTSATAMCKTNVPSRCPALQVLWDKIKYLIKAIDLMPWYLTVAQFPPPPPPPQSPPPLALATGVCEAAVSLGFPWNEGTLRMNTVSLVRTLMLPDHCCPEGLFLLPSNPSHKLGTT